MQHLDDKITGDITINSGTALHGMISGNVLVANSSEFIVYGMVIGSIKVDSSSVLVVHGMIKGDIENDGKTEIFGMVIGKVICADREKLLIHENAVIHQEK